MFFKPFELRGHRQCPHKPPSNCNTSVIPMSLNKFCPRKPQKPVHTHTHTHTRREHYLWITRADSLTFVCVCARFCDKSGHRFV